MSKTPVVAPLSLSLSLSLLPLLALTPLACAESIGFDDDAADGDDAADDDAADDDPSGGDGDADSGDERIEHDPLGGGVVRTRIDASDEAQWVYLDLDSMRGAAQADAGWELGFHRFEIVLSGGIGADPDTTVAVAIVEGVEFEGLDAVPDGLTWITDAADGDDEGSDPDLAFGDWYAYDPSTHVLTPKDRVYLVRTGEGAVFKLQLADYYSEAGTAGHISFYWAGI